MRIATLARTVRWTVHGHWFAMTGSSFLRMNCRTRRASRGDYPHPVCLRQTTFPQGKASCCAPCATFHTQNRKCVVGAGACPRCGIAIFSAERAENCAASLKTPRFICHRQRFGVFPDGPFFDIPYAELKMPCRGRCPHRPAALRAGITLIRHGIRRGTFPQGKASCGAPGEVFFTLSGRAR